MRPLIVLSIMAVIFLSGCVGQPSEQSQNQGQTGALREFSILAKQWQFDATDEQGNVITNSIVVNKGDRVKLTITSNDVPHGLAINEFGINRVINPGETVTVEFVADKSGDFGFFCSVFCGAGHGDMKGILTVN